jgi:hypothetical protein
VHRRCRINSALPSPCDACAHAQRLQDASPASLLHPLGIATPQQQRRRSSPPRFDMPAPHAPAPWSQPERCSQQSSATLHSQSMAGGIPLQEPAEHCMISMTELGAHIILLWLQAAMLTNERVLKFVLASST